MQQAAPTEPSQAQPSQSEPSHVDPSDVHVTLEYRMDAELADWLPIGVLTVFCGLALFAMAQPDLPDPGATIAAVLAMPVGIGIIALALWRRFRRGNPVYVLSPMGVHIRWPWVRELVIPWHEIKEVDTIDITWRHWLAYRPRDLTSRGVVVVLVSKPFYDAHIHFDSYFMRGPYWYEVSFIPKGELIQCALHSEIVSIEPRLLRDAVEARWRAFRDLPAAPVKPRGASVPSVIAGALRRATRGAATRDAAARPASAPRVVAAGDKPRPISWWQWVKIAVPLIGIIVAGSNLLGLWATEDQAKAFAKRKEWQEWRARFERERKESDERSKKLRDELVKLYRRSFCRCRGASPPYPTATCPAATAPSAPP
jgi:hypothetical protein